MVCRTLRSQFTVKLHVSTVHVCIESTALTDETTIMPPSSNLLPVRVRTVPVLELEARDTKQEACQSVG